MNVPDDPDYIVVGQVARLHGTKGDFFVHPMTDREDEVFVEGRRLRIADPTGAAPDERFAPVRIVETRPHKTGFLMHFEGIDDREPAELLRGRYLVIPFREVAPAAEGEFFYHELLGMSVETTDGESLGTVREVYPMDPADLLEVSDGTNERLIPYTRRIVRETDRVSRRIVIEPPPGLLEL
jgi:16S rRNA processing protein RimM